MKTKPIGTQSGLSVPIWNEVCCCIATKIVSMVFQQGTMTAIKSWRHFFMVQARLFLMWTWQ
jgi:hypothetical protein